MQQLNRVAILSAASLFAAGAVLIAQSDPKPKTEPKRPQISMKATPASGMVPVRVVGMVELKGGDDDFEEYYCPTIEWNWDDGTVSESSNDCEPYERGKSVIKRKYTVTHPYRQGGRYRITFKLKQKSKVVGGANAVVQLLGGGPY
ncbi:MAG TPA: hypothetical protein VL243_12730 [Vicinamibacterales bacterium]|nr:hypothetical protein [Vicinamibacterales bacterium]